MEYQILRCAAINNIPKSKLYLTIAKTIGNCENCKDKEINSGRSLDVGLCDKCRITTQAYTRYYEANIPLEYWDLKMDKDFHGYKGLLDKYNEYVKDLKSAYENGTSICFAGQHGVGKSFVICSILKKASLKGYSSTYTTISDIVSVLISGSSEDKFTARKELIKVDFLAIDEIDPRFVSSDSSSDLYARTLENVFRTRAQNKLPILMATNSPNVLETFNGALKESLGSLMSGYIKVFVVLGQDFRKK